MMANFKDHKEIIDKYLAGKMSKNEQLEFEIQLQNDPLLNNEFEFQKDIVESIRNFRRTEIKARLDNINVGAPSGFSFLKIAASVAVSSMIAVGSYMYLTSENSKLDRISISGNDEVHFQVESLPEKPELITSYIQAEEELPKAIEGKNPVAQREVIEKDLGNITASSKNTIAEPKVILPDLIDSFEDVNMLEADDDFANITTSFEAIKRKDVPDFEIENIDSDKFHYRFFDGKLFLYGDFSDHPYEIIELKSRDKKSVFLNYNDEYFLLEDNQIKVSPLIPISDSTVISELDILKNVNR